MTSGDATNAAATATGPGTRTSDALPATPPEPASEAAYRGDEDLLRRMLLNVVQNAVQHTRSGGTVRVHLAPASAESSAEASGWIIRVADEGPGISDGERERVFDRFVRLDPARRDGGAGLGLPIARWIADAHGGALSVESSSAAGTTFRIELRPVFAAV